MKLVASGERFRVIDDFLDPKDLDSIRRLMGEREFEEVPSVVDSDADGSAFRSRGAVLRHDAAWAQADTAGLSAMPGGYLAVLRELHSHSDFFGDAGTDWSIVGLSFWRYPAGSRLGWHNDVAVGRQGEFVFFLHEEWKASWGGELLLLDADPATVGDVDPDLPAYRAVEAKVGLAPYALTAVVPKPNRLVLVKEGTIHCIQRVDRTAGETLRQTMTGFVAAGLPEKRSERGNNIDRLVSLLGSE